MNEQKNVLESTTILNSINKNGITVLNMFNDDYRKFLTEILILESLNIKNTTALVFTLNEKKEDLIYNLPPTVAEGSLYLRHVQDNDWINMTVLTEKLNDSSICIADEYRTVDDIVLAISEYIRSSSKELNFVLIDNLGEIESDLSLTLIVKDLNIMAKHQDISLIILK
jgi:hypothetical protein